MTWKIVKFDEDDAGAWFDGVGGQAIIENEDDRVCKKKIIFEDDLQKIYVEYVSARYLSGYRICVSYKKDVVWKGITLSIDTNDPRNIIAQKECCQSKIFHFDQKIKQIICKNDVLFIFSQEGDFQRAEIELIPEHYTSAK